MTDSVAAIIPAKDEQDRVATTVKAMSSVPGVDVVIVVDDGSTDRTSAAAAQAGAIVVGHSRNRGKGAAMETGATALAAVESRERDARAAPRTLLFIDADLEETAAQAQPLLEPVVTGEADMAIAVHPTQRSAGGGHGLVVDLARNGIERATGWAPTQPLSGQRCITRAAFTAALPLAQGFGVETGLSIDLLRQGFRVVEVDVDFFHRVTGTDIKAQIHRGRQYAHVMRALLSRGVRPTVPARFRLR